MEVIHPSEEILDRIIKGRGRWLCRIITAAYYVLTISNCRYSTGSDAPSVEFRDMLSRSLCHRRRSTLGSDWPKAGVSPLLLNPCGEHAEDPICGDGAPPQRFAATPTNVGL